MSILKLDPSRTAIILTVKLKAKFAIESKFILDTGSSFVVLPWKLAVAIGLKVDRKTVVSTTSASKVEIVPKVVIPEMTVLGKRVKNVEAIVKDLPPQAPADGLLGLSFLKHFKLTINFKKGLLQLT